MDFTFHHLWYTTYAIRMILETSPVMHESREGEAALPEQESTHDSMSNFSLNRRSTGVHVGARTFLLATTRQSSRIGVMAKMEKKTLSAPDEQRSFDKGKIELVTLGEVTFGRATLQPGWKWSTCVKPIVNTKSCEASHLTYHVSGRMGVRMDDGSEAEFGPGDVSLIPPGHDAWVVGDQPVVVIDISGMAEYAKQA